MSLRQKLKSSLLENEQIQQEKKSGLTDIQIETAIDAVFKERALVLKDYEGIRGDDAALNKAYEIDMLNTLRTAVLSELVKQKKLNQISQLTIFHINNVGSANSQLAKPKALPIRTCAISGNVQLDVNKERNASAQHFKAKL